MNNYCREKAIRENYLEHIGGQDENYKDNHSEHYLDFDHDVAVHQVESVKDGTGAVYGIKWVSKDNAITIKGLSIGEVYTMEETGAPDGYEYSENIQFKLEGSENGTVIVKVFDPETNEYRDSDKVEMFDEAEDDDDDGDDENNNDSSSNLPADTGDSSADKLQLTKTGGSFKAPKTGEADSIYFMLLAVLSAGVGFGLLVAKSSKTK